MKKFVYSAVALAMATGASYAADTGWASLDQEISGLSSSLSAQNAGGPKVGGWVITSVRMQDLGVDTDGDGFGDADELGFTLDQVRLHVTGDVSNDYSYKIGFDLQDGEAELADAYIKWKLMDNISGTMGRFLYPTIRSATMDENKLLFLQRTELGAALYNDAVRGRSIGVAAGGGFEMVNFIVAVQNGEDETQDEFAFTVNVSADVMGKGAGSVEGAYGAAEGTNLSIGAFYHDDGALDSAMGVEAYFTMGALAVSGNYVQDDGILDGTVFPGVGEVSGYDLTVSYLFTEQYEASLRYESLEFDAPFEQTIIRAGINRYSAGHNLKWTLQYSNFDQEAAGFDISAEDEIALGATLAF
jgi:hypothetical protein